MSRRTRVTLKNASGPPVVIHRVEVGNVVAPELGRDLAAGDRIDDLARVDQLIGCGEQLDALEKEGPLLGEEQRESLVDRHQAGVRLDLAEVGIVGRVEREIAGEAQPQIGAGAGIDILAARNRPGWSEPRWPAR